MTKIVLQDTNSGHNLQTINDNFRKIEEELNEKVLYRDNPVGEPNEMENDLDMNGNRIYNLPKPVEGHEPLRLVDIGLLPQDLEEYVEESKEWAEKSQDAYENTLEALAAGSVYIGDYGPGLVIEEYTNFFGKDGVWWRPSPDLELPYTTTGDWGDEEGLFVAVGDRALRQELADTIGVNSGASLVARSTVSVKNVPDMLRYSESTADSFFLQCFSEVGDGGGGLFVFDPNKPKEDHDGGTVIDPLKSLSFGTPDWFVPVVSGSGCFVRDTTEINLGYFGLTADDGARAEYNTAALTSAIRTGENRLETTIKTPDIGERFYFSGEGPFVLQNGVSLDGGSKIFRMIQRDGFELLAGNENRIVNLTLESDHQIDELVPGDFFGIKVSRGNKFIQHVRVSGFHIGIWIAERQNTTVDQSRVIRCNICFRFGEQGKWANFNFLRNSQIQFSYLIGVEAVNGTEVNNYITTTNIEHHPESGNDPSANPRLGAVYVHEGAVLNIDSSWIESARLWNDGRLYLTNMQHITPGSTRIVNTGIIPKFQSNSTQISKPLGVIKASLDTPTLNSSGCDVEHFADSYFLNAPYYRVRVDGASGTQKTVWGPVSEFRGSYINEWGIQGVFVDCFVQCIDVIDNLMVSVDFINENEDTWTRRLQRVSFGPEETNKLVNIGGLVEAHGAPESFQNYRTKSVSIRLAVGDTNTSYASNPRTLRLFPSSIRMCVAPNSNVQNY